MRRAFAVLARLQLLAVVVQFFLAASGAFDSAANGESFRAHRVLGTGIVLLAVLVTVFAAAARMPGRLVALSGLVAGLAVVQLLIRFVAGAFDDSAGSTATGELIFGLHGVNGLALMGLTLTIVRRTRQPATPTPQVS